MWKFDTLAYWSAQDISGALFALTAALLILAECLKPRRIARLAALVAFPSILAANYYLLSDVPRMDLPEAGRHALARAGSDRQPGTGRGGATGRQVDPHAGHAVGTDADAETAEAGDHDGTGTADGPLDRLRALLSIRQPAPPLALLPRAGDTIKDCADCPELVVVGPGTPTIGADAADPFATPAETPRRRIPVWPGFAIGRAEISEAELAIFRDTQRLPPSACDNGNAARPSPSVAANCLSWHDATAYTAWLSVRTGKHYRLPSAVEWEYAAQLAAGPGPRLAAARQAASDAGAADVTGSPRFSSLGGGVAELTADCWRDLLELAGETSRPFQPASGCHTRVLKDGADAEAAQWKRSAARRPVDEATRSPRIGFRVVRELE